MKSWTFVFIAVLMFQSARAESKFRTYIFPVTEATIRSLTQLAKDSDSSVQDVFVQYGVQILPGASIDLNPEEGILAVYTDSTNAELVMYMLSTSYFSPQVEIMEGESSRSDGRNWPRSVNEAVDYLISRMSEDGLRDVQETKKAELGKFHMTWGMDIRNSLGLWQGNRPLLEDAGTYSVDRASQIIIEAVWEHLQSNKKEAEQDAPANP